MSLDALGRRSRFKRTPTGKRLALTERDIGILRWLYRYRFLSSKQLERLLRPHSVKRFVERLGDLYHEAGFINRPIMPVATFDVHSNPIIYEITGAGVAVLDRHGGLPDRAVTFSRRPQRSINPQFLHTLAVIDTLAEIELTTTRNTDRRFVPVDEILQRAPEWVRSTPNLLSVPVTLEPGALPSLKRPWQTHIIPDALYGIEYLIDGEKRYRFFALEVERTTPTARSSARHSSVARKRAAYDALIRSRAYRDHWGIPNLDLHLVQRSSQDTGTASTNQ